MATILRFTDRFAGELDAALRSQGFVKADTSKIASYMGKWKGQPLAYDNESIYVLNRDNGKPIFAVFMTKNDDRGTVSVLASNPQENLQASTLSQEGQYLKKTYSEKIGSIARAVEVLDAKVATFVSFKKYHRMQVHMHSGFMLDGSRPYDDGVSQIASTIRRALLHHVDILAYTPHNSFEIGNNNRMAGFVNEFGMVTPPACEMTMPLLPDHPSGPHHLVIAADHKAAMRIIKRTLKQRDSSLEMPAYFLGMTMDKMYEELEPLRRSNEVVIGAAHPVNFNDPRLPIGGVGLFSAVQHGHVSMQQAMDYASRMDFIECWNDSLHMGEMSFESPDFERSMQRLLSGHAAGLGIPEGVKLSANLCSLVLASELAERFGIGQSFGSDAHTEAALERDYAVGGDWFGRGWTTLDVPASMQDHKLRADEFVRGISKKQIRMGAVMFTQIIDNVIRIVEARTQRPTELERSISNQSRKVTANYAYVLAQDFAHFLAHGKFKGIKRMSE